ncbi:MAG: ABC transporter permease [Acidobacteriota bacterium]
MANNNKIKIIYNFFVKKLLRAKKTKFFILFSITPLLIFLIINGIKLLYNDNLLAGSDFFKNGGMPFFFQFYIQLVSLLFGAAVLSDEIDRKTLIYLNTSPVSKSSILSGKLAAYLSVTFIIFAIGSSVLYLTTHFKGIMTKKSLLTLLQLEFAGLIAIIAYSSLFLLFGVSLKKSTIIGLVYIFGWEPIAQILPGTAQKLTIFFYLNSLTPIRIPKEKGLLNISISQPGFAESLIILLLFSTVFFAASVYVFKKREYLLADHT